MSLGRFEELFADALRAPDPVEALRQASRDRALDPELRRLMENVDPDGLRLSALLVAKLRFQYLVRGSARASRFFEERPREFTNAFKRYHHEVPMTAYFPPKEAAQFHDWCDANQVSL